MLKKFIITVLLAFSATALRAYADDQPDEGAYVQCEPAAGYFSLATQQTHEDDAAIRQAHGLFLVGEIEHAPLTCALPGFKIVVRGRSKVSGAGICGARYGNQVQVEINGVVVRARMETRNDLSTVSDLLEGWIELSSCFEHRQELTVFSGKSGGGPHAFVQIVFCRTEDDNSDDLVMRDGATVTNIRGECRTWGSIEKLKQN